MTRAELIRQAKMLNPMTEREARVFGLTCKFKVKHRCQTVTNHLEYDPTGEFKLPAPSCNNCHYYIDNCFRNDIDSAEGHWRIGIAIARTYEALEDGCK